MKNLRETISIVEDNELSNIDRLLADHNVIGWDVDGTLLEHDNALMMHDYIVAHPEKKHFIVTFRSHGMENRIFQELGMEYEDRSVERAHFNGVVSVPYAVYENWANAERNKFYNMPHEQGHIDTYQEWKGRVCAEHGITVLVDDDTANVQRGCDQHGIAHVNPDDL